MRPVAVIPSAGSGTRLRPHTITTPKPLLSVAGKPILGHILDQIALVQPEKVILVIGPGPHGDRLRAYAASRTDLEVRCVLQEEPLGLGHAVLQAAGEVGTAPSLILLGDTIIRADLRGLVSGGSKVGVREVEDPRRFGVAELEKGRIVSLVEKPEHPKSNLALVGLYYLEDSPLLFSCLEHVERSGKRTKGEIQLTDGLAEMLARGADLRPFPVEGWYDCGKTDALLETNRALLDVSGNHVERPGVIVVPPVALDPTAEVSHAIIGPHASIGARARVTRSVVRNSIVNDGAVVEDILLDLSVIGENTVVRGGYHRLNVGDSSEVEVS